MRHIVLVGGGHSHIQVLKHFAEEPPPKSRLTVVVDTPVAVYSGMVPGFVAGQYRSQDLEIDVRPLARQAQAEVVVAPAVAVDTSQAFGRMRFPPARSRPSCGTSTRSSNALGITMTIHRSRSWSLAAAQEESSWHLRWIIA